MQEGCGWYEVGLLLVDFRGALCFHGITRMRSLHPVRATGFGMMIARIITPIMISISMGAGG
jgi:hypothetical protein